MIGFLWNKTGFLEARLDQSCWLSHSALLKVRGMEIGLIFSSSENIQQVPHIPGWRIDLDRV